ncbi:MAG: hypothetical protein FP813_03750 [Desulfurivibrio sp.]|nr:hypothetical protein [Desulfurivibrio sp.]MBU3937525.1 hypothetical protein [Pseudomonadota bacterium]MBU4119796.1 hypothetical protein [Pseudomonadota bacterium]
MLSFSVLNIFLLNGYSLFPARFNLIVANLAVFGNMLGSCIGSHVTVAKGNAFIQKIMVDMVFCPPSCSC